jgi:hypothetical protein
MIFSLEQSIPERLKSQFRELFVRTLFVVTVLYISFGASGYLSFGPRTKGNNEGYQPPVSATRWQHWSQICFATFIWRKITKLLIIQQPLKLEKNKHRFVGILRILEKF